MPVPPRNASAADAPHIGVFDSGIGGLSVLAALRRRRPDAHISYLADSRYTPWGERGAGWVRQRCLQLAGHLIDRGAQLVLVACNTGTTQAIAALRAQWPALPFVGVEPGIKPAVAASRSGRVAVMATSGTIRSPRLAQLVAEHAAGAELLRLPCPGLVEAIEAVDTDPAALPRQLDAIAAQLRAAAVDTVVLGCTHYPLVAAALQRRLGPGVHLLDTGDAVARRVDSLLAADTPTEAPRDPAGPAAPEAPDAPDAPGTPRRPNGPLTLLTTGPTEALQAAARRWLQADAQVQVVRLPEPLPAEQAGQNGQALAPPLPVR